MKFKKFMCSDDPYGEDEMLVLKKDSGVIFECRESGESSGCQVNKEDVQELIKFLEEFIKGY